jgi:hypothetical protein
VNWLAADIRALADKSEEAESWTILCFDDPPPTPEGYTLEVQCQMTEERNFRQKVFIRVCRDSGFKLEPSRAAQFAAQLIGIHPFEILNAIGCLNTMNQIADGTHPVLQMEEYK